MAPSREFQRKVNKWAARLIPLFLMGGVGFDTWVVVALIAVNYLLRSPPHVEPNTGAGVAIIVLHFVIMIPMSLCYLRTLQAVVSKPGYVSMPASREDSGLSGLITPQESSTDDVRGQSAIANDGVLDRGAVHEGRVSAPPGLEQLYSKDIFQCDIDGLPRWCSVCKAWKPDRSHHSSEVGKCVHKMDHFCPWAGGIISRTSFKFFTQFVIYGTAYNTFVLIVCAYYIAHRHNLGDLYEITWIVALAFSGVFVVFAFGMSYNSMGAILQNSTTVDNLGKRSRIHHFAVRIPSDLPHRPPSSQESDVPPPYSTITFPLRNSLSESKPNSQPPSTFAILETPTGSTPYQLPSKLENFKTVMGEKWYDWFLPIRYSPCCSDEEVNMVGFGDQKISMTSMYKTGPVVEQIMFDAGLIAASEKEVEVDRYGRKRLREKRS